MAKSSPLTENPSSNVSDNDHELLGERAGQSGTQIADVAAKEDSSPENQVQATENSGDEMSREGQETGTVPRHLRDRMKLRAPVSTRLVWRTGPHSRHH